MKKRFKSANPSISGFLTEPRIKRKMYESPVRVAQNENNRSFGPAQMIRPSQETAIAKLFESGMGCEALPHLDVGVKRNKLGRAYSPMSHKQYKRYKEQQVQNGAFQLCYTESQLAKVRQKNLGIGMVDLDKLPAFLNNKQEKIRITDTDQVYNPERRRFDQAYNTTRIDSRLKQEFTPELTLRAQNTQVQMAPAGDNVDIVSERTNSVERSASRGRRYYPQWNQSNVIGNLLSARSKGGTENVSRLVEEARKQELMRCRSSASMGRKLEGLSSHFSLG